MIAILATPVLPPTETPDFFIRTLFTLDFGHELHRANSNQASFPYINFVVCQLFYYGGKCERIKPIFRYNPVFISNVCNIILGMCVYVAETDAWHFVTHPSADRKHLSAETVHQMSLVTNLHPSATDI